MPLEARRLSRKDAVIGKNSGRKLSQQHKSPHGAIGVPEISGDQLQPPDDRVIHLAREQSFKIADVVPDGYQPGVGMELIVGTDYYWDITTGSVNHFN
ncbi:hypothetical protein MRX96_001538 [Rhipicephalus microplus]